MAKEGIGGLPYDLGVRFGEGDFFPVGFRPKAAGTYEAFDRGGVFHEDDPHAGMDAVTAGTAAHLPLPHPYVVGEIVGGAALLEEGNVARRGGGESLAGIEDEIALLTVPIFEVRGLLGNADIAAQTNGEVCRFAAYEAGSARFVIATSHFLILRFV